MTDLPDNTESSLAPTGGGLPYVWELQLIYADQRGGHGTAHWWRLYYGDFLKSQVETILQGTALVTGTIRIGTMG